MIKTLPKKINKVWFTENISRSMFKLSVILFVFSIFFQVFFTNNLAIKSKDLNDLSLQKDVLHKEIARLEFEDSKASSLALIEQKAYESGFVKLEKNVLAIKPAPSVSAAAVKAY
jgi:hypothetical protein